MKEVYTLPELAILLNEPQEKVLDEIEEILAGMSVEERKQYISRTDVHEL